ncbi:unnamed protein product [Peniophora sp. CBMAI 1063]|nr:unnamed protein product [Peniophora sp. CBMAI 1063]
MVQSLPFLHMTAFSTHIAGGNPAAVVFLTPEQNSLITDDTRQVIGANWYQPMTALVAPRPIPEGLGQDNVRAFDVKYYTANIEIGLCGHATLCAASALFDHPTLTTPTTTVLEFHAKNGRIVARKLEDGLVEIELPVGRHEPLAAEDPRAVALRAALARALGPDVKVNFMGAGLAHLEIYCLIEIETDDLRNLKVKVGELIDSPFTAHVLTMPSRDPSVAFISRMFAPAAMIPEDHVCGTAHSMMTPYWAVKAGLKDQLASDGVRAIQVSPRGGELKVWLDEQKGVVKLAGPVATISTGELYV